MSYKDTKAKKKKLWGKTFSIFNYCIIKRNNKEKVKNEKI